MDSFNLLQSHLWRPLAWLGLTHSFWDVEAETVVYTWVALCILAIGAFIARLVLVWHPNSLFGYLVRLMMNSLRQVIQQACKGAPYHYLVFFGTLLAFILVCNCLVIFPYCEEPTRDINTTLALSAVVFLFIQKESIVRHGLIAYANEFFKTPLTIRGTYHSSTAVRCAIICGKVCANIAIGLLLLPLELIGKLSSVISLAFRLFGNILAGSVISSIWLHCRSGSFLLQLGGIPLNLIIVLFFGLFEGVVQALVFVMLSLSWLGRTLEDHS